MLPIQVDAATTAGMTYIRYVEKGLGPNDADNNSAILRIDETVAGVTNIGWAGGSKAFAYQWSLRAAYVYEPLKR